MSDNNPLRDHLLGHATDSAAAAAYRETVARTIEKDRIRIRRERLLVTLFWIFCAVSATVRLWFSADAARLPREPFLACIFFTWGGVEVVKHYINSCRVDLMKELKQLQVQVFELQQNQESSRRSEIQ